MKRKHVVFILMGFALLVAAQAKKLSTERPYEPIVINGWSARQFIDVPVKEIFVFAYNNSSDSWRMIPFQIDERVKLPDPAYPERGPRHFYVQPNTNSYMYTIQDTAAGWDFDDELCFMAADLGDKAPDQSWIDNADAIRYDRLELKFSDPLDPQCVGYAYLYRSSTLSMPDSVASAYGMAFDPAQHIVQSFMYTVRLQRPRSSKQNGLLANVAVKPPYGNGVDFFDLQKLRFVGSVIRGFYIPIGKDGAPAGTEDFLVVYGNDDYLSYTDTPVVRVVREVRQTIGDRVLVFDEFGFYVRTKFYPFSGRIEGGASLHSDSLNTELDPNEDYYVELEYIRQSWDLNEQAAGMRYYNARNNAIAVDGNPDQVDHSIVLPISEWNMVSGDQGTFFNYVELEESNWESVQLYYLDDSTGGAVADDIDADNSDSGDGKSFADHGLMMHRQTDPGNINLELGFTAYFLSGNKDLDFAMDLASRVRNPIAGPERRLVAAVAEKPVAAPALFTLLSNYPNPFNGSTTIRFSLSRSKRLNISIYDVSGKKVITLAQKRFVAGTHELTWPARDHQGQQVASGVYLLKMTGINLTGIRKLTFIK